MEKRSPKQRIVEHPLYVRHRDKVRFMMVGGVNTVLDFTIYGLLVSVLGFFAVVANMISTVIVLTISFGLNYKFVWQSKKSKRETAPRFVIISLFSAWVVQSGIIWIIVTIFGTDDVISLLAKVVGICAGTITNYLGYRYIFR
ncbi:GtrA family protein [Candidatus Saccharibacteria bacterium]|nr:GtrA family protein [Candidatus Saccharibacteria bacterium]